MPENGGRRRRAVTLSRPTETQAVARKRFAAKTDIVSPRAVQKSAFGASSGSAAAAQRSKIEKRWPKTVIYSRI